jgi:hypothetical protein
MRKPETRVKLLQRTQTAFRELELNAVTYADKERFARVWKGIWALDEEQAELKEALECVLQATTLEQAKDIARAAYKNTVPKDKRQILEAP